MTAGYCATTVAPGDDVIRRPLNRPLATEPARRSVDDGSCTCSAIPNARAGCRRKDFARRTLFEPLESTPEMADRPPRHDVGSTGSFCTRGLALGELYPSRPPEWTLIVPTAWARDRHASRPAFQAYAMATSGGSTPAARGFPGAGYAGQALAVDPRLDLVVAAPERRLRPRRRSPTGSPRGRSPAACRGLATRTSWR
jgi:hypothetical protein